jgi:hypothetical protein
VLLQSLRFSGDASVDPIANASRCSTPETLNQSFPNPRPPIRPRSLSLNEKCLVGHFILDVSSGTPQKDTSISDSAIRQFNNPVK